MMPVISKTLKVAATAVWLYFSILVLTPAVLREAYQIRLIAIQDYGTIIHEFDPYFNYRATEYLYAHGRQKFFQWFDYMSWYPLGRPVGTTIYPGLQFTAVWIKNHIFGDNMSLNDVCCYVPAWFGVIATFFTGMLAYECSLPVPKEDSKPEEPFESIFESIPGVAFFYQKGIMTVADIILKFVEKICGTDFGLRHRSTIVGSGKFVDLSSPAVEIALVAGGIMSIVPAHLMRSMGGGFDNESIAMAAMVLTFYLWCRSLRGGRKVVKASTWFWGVATGVAYFNMVAAWGGYVFVLNLIGVHAGLLFLTGRYSTKLYRAYTAFYAVGTLLAMQIPVVGWTPLKSLEQMGPLAVFLGFQLIEFIESVGRKRKLSSKKVWALRFQVFAIAGLFLLAVAAVLNQVGYFGPISSRIRGLFVKHTKTGNPLVDSVAEHQPASANAYDQYLGHLIVSLVPTGFVLVAVRYFHDSSSFLLVYALTAYFFSLKMVRLILLAAPIASILCGVTIGRVFGFLSYNIFGFPLSILHFLPEKKKVVSNKKSSKKKKKGTKDENGAKDEVTTNSPIDIGRSVVVKLISVYACYLFIGKYSSQGFEFIESSKGIAQHFANPTIISKGNLQSGQEVIMDDYRDCYNWIRENTPEDSRVMSWWDYGYQLTAIANRTTMADGNTWNHEHIALLGRALTSPEKEGHRIARHMADYILVWTGGGGDDVAKSPHIVRIANSVYRDMCPNDPVCTAFGYTPQGQPTKMMRESLLYKLHSHGVRPGVIADPNRFRPQFTSQYGKCRVFKVLSVSKESKEWVANPANRKCDTPGGWYCPGQYPPGMQKILKEKRDFSQLEDFNRGEKDNEYQQKYFENLAKREKGERVEAPNSEPKKKKWVPNVELSEEQMEEINKHWSDSPITSKMWELISGNRLKEMMDILSDEPELAHVRSKDGRGPMFWAMEFGNEKVVRLLKRVGVKTTTRDAQGLTPLDLKKDDL